MDPLKKLVVGIKYISAFENLQSKRFLLIVERNKVVLVLKIPYKKK